MIKKPGEAKFADKHLIMLIYGLPGVGKTTLALSAPNPFLTDVDQGAVRVRREHLSDYDDTQAYKELLDTFSQLDPKVYSTVIIDTVGALIEVQKSWAGETDPKNALKAGGGFALAGYGIIKSEFIRLAHELSKRFNVVLIFHASREKHGDQTVYELVCEGAAKVFSWQPADLGAYMYIERGKRFLGFTPTIEYSAKSGHGIKGIIEIPEISPGQPNDFLTRLFAQVRENIAADDAAGAVERDEYARIMEEGAKIVADVKCAADVLPAAAKLKQIGEAMTSTTELRGQMTARLKTLGITYDKVSKSYLDPVTPTEPEPEVKPVAEVLPVAVEGGGLL